MRRITASLSLALAVVLLGLSGCFIGTWPTPEGKKSPDGNGGGGGGGCYGNDDCDAGQVCVDRGCVSLCRSDHDCESGDVCHQGMCSPEPRHDPPEIHVVYGNQASDPTRVENGLIVEGALLDGAAFYLDEISLETRLTVASLTDEEVELLLPVDVHSGPHVLFAANQVGADQASVTLTLPELTGNILLGRINTAATGTFVIDRLPVGTGTTEVATGDHDHPVACPAGTSLVTGSTSLCIDDAWTTSTGTCGDGFLECRLLGEFLCPFGVDALGLTNAPGASDLYALDGAVAPCGTGGDDAFYCGEIDGSGMAYTTEATTCLSEVTHRYICCVEPKP